ncbi:MAG: flavin reductase family protein [Candidatus Latescibacteria bacterium]|nr:flavin reductase family protein [bacterium]MBD3422866.1 flavin reductase family protein [Candidatus Latescibacterota bacterium]
MDKIKIDSSNAYLYPMPMVIVGSVVDGKPNFMPVAWVSRVNYRPPMFAVAIGPHYSSRGIEENGEFSVNIPSISMMERTDYCGLVSGVKRDKSEVFDIFYGELENAPLIEECPVSMACSVSETVEMKTNQLFIGEVLELYSEERYLTDGNPDIEKIEPFTLTMPGNRYWAVGSSIGKAWNAGKSLIKKD